MHGEQVAELVPWETGTYSVLERKKDRNKVFGPKKKLVIVEHCFLRCMMSTIPYALLTAPRYPITLPVEEVDVISCLEDSISQPYSQKNVGTLLDPDPVLECRSGSSLKINAENSDLL